MQLLAAGKAPAARALLEKIVGNNPQFAGAWLDLAVAAYQSGDPTAALEHLEYLQTRFDVPVALQPHIDALRALCESAAAVASGAPLSSPSLWATSLDIALGTDTNPNAGLQSNRIELTLPDTGLTLDVDPAFLPRPQPFTQVGVQGRRVPFSTPVGTLVAEWSLQSRTLHQSSELSTLDLQAGVSWRPRKQGVAPEASPLAAGWQLAASVQAYQQGNEPLFRSLRAAALNHGLWGACAVSGALEAELRTNQRSPSLGGTLLGLRSGGQCSYGASLLGASARLGREHAAAGRPGADNHFADLSFSARWALARGLGLHLSAQTSALQDDQGYSALLKNNTPRQVQRNALGAALHRSIAPGWALRLQLEVYAQSSNLALFTQRGSVAMLSVSYSTH